MWRWMSNKLWRYFWGISGYSLDFGGNTAIIYLTHMGVFRRGGSEVSARARQRYRWDRRREIEREGAPQSPLSRCAAARCLTERRRIVREERLRGGRSATTAAGQGVELTGRAERFGLTAAAGTRRDRNWSPQPRRLKINRTQKIAAQGGRGRSLQLPLPP
jgi:hypothetical protein